MDDKELIFYNRCLEFLTYFRVSFEGDTIYLTDGGKSCIMNPNTEWKEFIGHSVNSVAEYVAKKMNKPTKWLLD